MNILERLLTQRSISWGTITASSGGVIVRQVRLVYECTQFLLARSGGDDVNRTPAYNSHKRG